MKASREVVSGRCQIANTCLDALRVSKQCDDRLACWTTDECAFKENLNSVEAAFLIAINTFSTVLYDE